MRGHLGQPPLGALVQLLLQPPALRILRLDDPPARCGELLDASAHLRLEANVAHGDPCRCGDGLDERAVVEHGPVVHQHRDVLAFAVDQRHRTVRTRPRDGQRPARLVHVAAP